MKNWFNRESHPTDNLIHWQDEDFCLRGWGMSMHNFKSFEKYVDALRAAYDLIASDPKMKAALDLLMEAQRHKCRMEERDDRAGEDL